MPTAFKTNPIKLTELLSDCASGKIQLPDFQRSWVWDEGRILSLIASVSLGFPVGALMTLEMKADVAETFARRPLHGTPPEAEKKRPEQLLLDGQQRMTSLYQTCMRGDVVEMLTPKQRVVCRWFYIDIVKALTPGSDRIDAIVAVPEDRKLKSDFNRKVDLDLSTPELEYGAMMFPLNRTFDWDEWQEAYGDYWIARGQPEKRDIFRQFKKDVLENIKGYQVPVIALGDNTSHEAVCLVFEKVNTGGKPLDAFELVTSMYAAKGFRLREDWLGDKGQPGIQRRLQTFGKVGDQPFGILEKVSSTDLLQAISLLHTKQVRQQAMVDGVNDADLPPVRATRQSLLDLPLDAYRAHRAAVEEGFRTVAKFLRLNGIYRVIDLPYQSQLVPLAAILAEIGQRWEHAANREKLSRWFWCGIFGELYGSATDSRFAKDVMEVPAWLEGGAAPTTVADGVFLPDRLKTMRTRLSAAYKGIHALLMLEGAQDFRSGQKYDQTVFFDEAVDIHHIFPQAWCKQRGIDAKIFDTIINKTPLSYRTNRIIGGVAPSAYIANLENGKPPDRPPLAPAVIDGHLRSHGIDPALLRADRFDDFLADRERWLLSLIAKATGHPVMGADIAGLDGDDAPDDLLRDAGMMDMAAE